MLIRPEAPNILSFVKVLDSEPLELEYLHTVLMQNGFTDYIHDGLIEKESVQKSIIREQPDVVAITGYITQEKLMRKFCQQAKEINPRIITMVGGVHAQRNSERFYDESIDYIVKSEGCHDFMDLIFHIDGNKKVELSQINGLCYKKNGLWQNNELKPCDMNDLPIPDRSFFEKNKKHYNYLFLKEIASIKTSASCPFNCSFCYCTLLNSGKYTVRNLDLVIEELKGISATNIQICDNDFLVDPVRIRNFIRLVRENKIQKTYVCYTRADFVVKHPDIIKELTLIGFRLFLVGLEAVTDDTLKSYNKKTSTEMNEKCVEIINATSADCVALMITPIDADKQYFKTLYDWIVKVDLGLVTLSVFTPIPGTPTYEEYKGQYITDRIEEWDFLHLVIEPTKLTRKQFYFEYYKILMKLYRRARKLEAYKSPNLEYYKDIISSFLRRKIKGDD